MPTPTQEDYLKAIWTLIQTKGYARVSDIADRLGIRHASVSRMVRRLHAEGLTTYEPYRGLNLTPAGRRRGRALVERQRVLRAWLVALGLGPGPELDRTVEGIEHHFGPQALRGVERLVAYIGHHEAWWRQFRDAAGGEGTGPDAPAPETEREGELDPPRSQGTEAELP
ncbi:MAG: MarR family transcriptional regulator [Firmicutes bacterium]|nr:MarR family transcriptional regulator [Bacillota bacterium]